MDEVLRRGVACAALLLTALMLASCGGDDGDDSRAEGSPEAAGTSAPAASPPERVVDASEARACLEDAVGEDLIESAELEDNRFLKQFASEPEAQGADGLIVNFSEKPRKYGIEGPEPGPDGVPDTADDDYVASDMALYFFKDAAAADAAGYEAELQQQDADQLAVGPQTTELRDNVYVRSLGHESTAAQFDVIDECVGGEPQRPGQPLADAEAEDDDVAEPDSKESAAEGAGASEGDNASCGTVESPGGPVEVQLQGFTDGGAPACAEAKDIIGSFLTDGGSHDAGVSTGSVGEWECESANMGNTSCVHPTTVGEIVGAFGG